MKDSILASPLLGIESFNQVLSELKKDKQATALCTGVIPGQKCHLAWAFSAKTSRPMVIVTHNEAGAREILRDMTFFASQSGGECVQFPARDYLSSHVDASGKEGLTERIALLAALANGSCPHIVCSIEALFTPLAPLDEFKNFIINIAAGDEISLDALAKDLTIMGYERCDAVYVIGQFAIRGGIIDIFAPGFIYPVRMEFWGDEVDSIRELDPISQRSTAKLNNIEIFPAREMVYDSKRLAKAVAKINKELKRSHNERVAEDAELLAHNYTIPGVERYAPYFYEVPATLFDYLPADTIICYDEPGRIAASAAEVHDEYLRFMEGRLEAGDVLSGQFASYLNYITILKASEHFDRLLFSMLAHNLRDIKATAIAHFDVKSSAIFANRLDLLEEDLRYFKSQDYVVIILAGSASRARRLCEELTAAGFSAGYAENLEESELIKGHILLNGGNLSVGFDYPHLKLAIISGAELFGEESKGKRRTRRNKKRGAPIESFTELNVGDYVVHDNHGVGIYRGLEKIEIDGAFRDYLKINYHADAILYIAINQMDSLQKYIGGENLKPRMNRLGGADWQKTKARAKAAVEEVAKELVELYAKREAVKGYGYSEDTVWQAEFEEMFIHEETEDQLSAVEDVKRDMESQKVMDRLICGDVGYGKTEVAIRAAFKAVCDQKQVAYLCPTTILAQQHYNTFVQRMKEFPVNIEVMSRFRSPKEQKATLEKLKNGLADIVIGTHRLLSKDVEFKNLGLIIVDEEQRFGVLHKEKLKQNWENVDVMTLTATPIPRTLHMSLSGIRDMSILEEPPLERQPIQTYVLEYSEEIVKSAVNRELNRGGQVYYLHNRVQNISQTAARIGQLVPDAHVAYAHGQMTETELEHVMMDFIDGTIDVLVCTTIIESGLDIPNVNTIIIQDADNMGLAQLYQLRGRVGRASRSSFAYLMYRKDKVLTEVAEKRLSTIREFTEFGSGFKIAMRDLEIRGAGNILGASQHGHMDAVGYEMYCKLLDLAVKEMRGIEIPKDFETLIDINIDAFISEAYIKNEHQKLEIYKKISHITNEKDFYDVQEEMEDRFGELPRPAQNLLNIALLKARAHAIDITSITQKSGRIIIAFKGDAGVDPLMIGQIVKESRGKLKFTLGTEPFLTYRYVDGEDFMGAVSDIVVRLKNIS